MCVPNLTISVGLRYDYDPAVQSAECQRRDREWPEPARRAVRDRFEATGAYTTGCGSPQMPPCVPGGLNSSNPAFNVTVGGVTYNTLNNIVFSPQSADAAGDQR